MIAWLGKKYGFIDKNGKVVIEPQFDNVCDFLKEVTKEEIDDAKAEKAERIKAAEEERKRIEEEFATWYLCHVFS